MRRRPYSVVLLDEVEKADPEIFNILLQVLDDGRLTDGQGRTVDFRNTILILTSNLGSMFLTDPDLSDEEKREGVMNAVRASFKPEFLNRLDETVIFDPLSPDDLSGIVDLYDPAYGARPLRRLIQREIGDRLAKLLLSGELTDGEQVLIDVSDDLEELKIEIIGR